jgi:hypothetical protein
VNVIHKRDKEEGVDLVRGGWGLSFIERYLRRRRRVDAALPGNMYTVHTQSISITLRRSREKGQALWLVGWLNRLRNIRDWDD